MTGAGRRKSLTEHVREVLAERIASDSLQPGDRLPTEREMIVEFGVSRTVVRDAVQRLRADGLVESRQGAGVFVRDPAQPRMRAEAVATLSSIIDTIEVRAAIEIEAARLAAERGSPAQHTEIGERWQAMQGAEPGEEAEAADFAFHLAIAAATNNRRFVEFFDFLGPQTIPRTQLRRMRHTPTASTAFLEGLQREHRAICDAIFARDADAAGEAMRHHLQTSQERYIGLIRSSTG